MNPLLYVWKVMYSLYLKHCMGCVQVAIGSMKFSQTSIILKYSHCAKQCNSNMYESIAVYIDDLLCAIKKTENDAQLTFKAPC